VFNLISIIIPAKNEWKTIPLIIRIAKQSLVNLDKEIIIVATDKKTAEVAKKECVKVILQKDKGKGNGMKFGFKDSSGEIIVFTDADILNFNKGWIEKTAFPIIKNEADVVIGYYKLPWYATSTELIYRPLIKLLFPEVENKIKGFPLSGQRAFKRKILKRIEFYPNYGVEAAMNIDLVNLKPVPIIKEVSLGKKVDIFKKVNIKLIHEIIEAIIDRAEKYNKVSILLESNFIQVEKILLNCLKKLVKE
jgi:glycosyltransferase involved in cell wall biosynthesis